MGANGAGKSTLVKILTGAVHPDDGTILVRGEPYVARSPAEARQGGVVSVYQEPRRHPGPGHPVEPSADQDPRRTLPSLARRAGHRRPGSLGYGAGSAAGHAPRDRPGARAVDRAGRPDARRDDRGPAGGSDRAGPARHREPAWIGSLHHLHLPPTHRDRGGVRPGHGPARRRDRRRGRRERRIRGPDRRPHARGQRQGPRDPRRRPRPVRPARVPPPHPGSSRANCASARDSRTRPSNSVPARSSGWPPWKDRARTSCSMCSPGRAAPMAASCSSMVRRSRSGIPRTPSGPVWSTSPPTGPRPC